MSAPVYLAGHCWVLLKATDLKPERLCFEPAAKYILSKPDASQTPSLVTTIWVCEKHRKAIEKSGYTLTRMVLSSMEV
jgi:hypothetical protein